MTPENKHIKPDIRFLVMDVDGTLTDGGMYFSESGDEFKRFNTKDGMAMKRLSAKGFHLGMLSSGLGKNMAQRRAKLLGVKFVYVGERNKLEVLNEWLLKLEISMDQTAYIGDDINDLEVIGVAGFSACPSDSHFLVREAVDIVLETKGGEGCIREFADKFLDYL